MQQTDDYHFSFSLAVLGEAATGKSRMIRCTLPPPHDDEEDEDPAVDHGIRCRSHTYESRGARYQIFMWEVPGAARYLESATRYATMAAGVLLIFAGITQLITAVVILAIFATKEPIGFLFVAVFIGVGALNIHGGLLCLRAEQAIVQARLKRGKAVPQYYSEEEDGQYYDEEQQAPSIPVTVRLAC